MPPRRHASSNSSERNARAAAAILRKASALRPTLAIVLGSGFHHLPSAMRIQKTLPYNRLPGFPRPTVGGHAGQLHVGTLANTPVLVLSGRSHYYEGASMEDITFYVRVLAACGITALLLTNAAGG